MGAPEDKLPIKHDLQRERASAIEALFLLSLGAGVHLVKCKWRFRSYDELLQMGVRFVLLPESAFGRFLSGPEPTLNTPEWDYYMANQTYLKSLLQHARTQGLVKIVETGSSPIYLLSVLPPE